MTGSTYSKISKKFLLVRVLLVFLLEWPKDVIAPCHLPLIFNLFPLKIRAATCDRWWIVLSIHLADGFFCTYILSWPAPTLNVSRGITGDGAGTTGSTFICTREHNHQSKTVKRLPNNINYMKALIELTRVYWLNTFTVLSRFVLQHRWSQFAGSSQPQQTKNMNSGLKSQIEIPLTV